MIAKRHESKSGWTFRREITFGVLLQLLVLGVMVLAGWVNLQKQLAIIQHDLSRVLQTQQQTQTQMELLSRQVQRHEYRLSGLEEKG